MKSRHLLFSVLFFISACNQNNSSSNDGIQWFGNDEIANAFVSKGMFHLLNAQFDKAYTYFSGAVYEDDTLFAPHVVLAMLSSGDKREMHTNKANKLVSGKNQNSKLYVSSLEILGDDNSAKREAMWKQMHEAYPAGSFIHYQYANSITNQDERINALEALLKQKKSEEAWYYHILNRLGYAHYNNGKKEKAKSYFDEYISDYPGGYNPYDSMAEYYFNEEDFETSLEYYEKALSKYPMSRSANNKAKDLREKLKK